ncbi:hypothetical protein [Ruficoccus sp. ZRK36]|uniref:hypothetical protein n=1 Tax=Ruficoccus sp. ZRK36 TaxID=2866311 RepID=UPI001C730433|nr:hypothetical protein [Ruficoccus sp. ZRK36]QYY37441.1 hypothetical protein K0V07_08125 [Ruficoccus sp. ZRK36]
MGGLFNIRCVIALLSCVYLVACTDNDDSPGAPIVLKRGDNILFRSDSVTEIDVYGMRAEVDLSSSDSIELAKSIGLEQGNGMVYDLYLGEILYMKDVNFVFSEDDDFDLLSIPFSMDCVSRLNEVGIDIIYK